MTAKNLAVICEGIIKRYVVGNQDFLALNKVNFEVRTGELMIISGPSGSGKTTLISVIAGILNYEEGECIIYDTHLNKMTETEKLAFRAKNIGFVFQQFNLIPTLTVAENVAIPLIINGMERHEANEKAAIVLEKVGLGNRINSSPRELSGGQQQRVAIARAIVHNPKMIVCDEPTSALDSVNGHNIMTILKDLSQDDSRALIVVTHDSRVFSFADRIAEMEDGKIIKISTQKVSI